MTAPFPYEAVSGAVVDPAESESQNLYRNYAWLARWSDEMTKDADVNYKKLMQFVLHCLQYRRWYDALQARGAPAREVIEGYFALKKCRWATRAAMLADLTTLYDTALAIVAWIKANMPAARTYATLKLNDVDDLVDEPINGVKPAEFAARIAAFRACFI